LPPFDFDGLKAKLESKFGSTFISEEDVVSAALYPKVVIAVHFTFYVLNHEI